MKQFNLDKGMQRVFVCIAALAAAIALTFALVGCAVQPVGTTTNENAAANRQYMAQLNQKTGELEEVLTAFQTAVSASDAVGMKAASDRAGKIIESVKALEVPTSEDASVATLASVKELYVAGLEGLDEAMGDYADLYAKAAAGTINGVALEREVKAIQGAYDAAVEKVAAADEELVKLASE